MKILITGAGGLLGCDLFKTLNAEHEVYGCGRIENPEYIPQNRWMKLDITDQEDTYRKISKLNPEIVINTAAFSDVNGCEKDPELAFKINALGTRNLCVACQRFDATLCHISTDYVFDGKNPPAEGYSEYDKTNPLSLYAKSKYWAEFYVKHLLNKFYILRVAWLFGTRRNNFVSYVLESIEKQKEIKVVKGQWGSPTYTKDVSEAISLLIKKPTYGIFHMTNTGKASRESLVEEIFRITGTSTKIALIDPNDIYIAPRPEKSFLRNYIWQLEGYRPIRTWQEAIKEFIATQNRAII
ncbi:MAG: dTDP-4-dehydrorhamnose reductase [Elusimicrobia bacterium RIFOXYA2_FULL_40_6]|nr:MAG: dTDP-4-dehydrorhamnose reductase [Elusimicrobia bacterium RIFOXYA2_FULL_40_6]